MEAGTEGTVIDVLGDVADAVADDAAYAVAVVAAGVPASSESQVPKAEPMPL